MSALAGKRVVITRAPHQAGDLERLLHEQGAVSLSYPCIDIAPRDDAGTLKTALRAAMNGAFDWLILTSTNTVRALKQCFDAMEINPGDFAQLQVAAVGSETAQAAHEQLGLHISFTPETYVSEALAQEIPVTQGMRILIPQSAIADSSLSAALSGRGAQVTVVEAYQTIVGSGGVDLPALLAQGSVDAITFTSASTVTNCLQRLHSEGGDITLLSRLCLAYIGSKTAAIAHQYHLPVTVVPVEHTLKGLVTALADYYTQITIGESE
jgi:uroporphyrinogen-III synthase